MSAAARKSRSSEGQVAESVELCKVCGDLEGDDKWVSCDMCSSWVHISCAGLDDADFKYLTKVKKAGKSIHWFCGERSFMMRPTLTARTTEDKTRRDFVFEVHN